MSKSGKRQRRSYSCGPCKLLKIKCDLQLPCSSCKKFKREVKCMQSPPSPPSPSEVRIIQERRERMKKRKRSSLAYTGDSGSDSTGSNQASVSDKTNSNEHESNDTMAVNIGSDFNFVANTPQQFFVQYQLYRAPLTAPSGFVPITSLVPKDTLKPVLSIGAINSAQEKLPYPENPYKQLQIFFESKKISLSFFDDEWNTLKIYYYPRGVHIFENSVRLESSRPSQIPAADVNLLKLTFPNVEQICWLFLAHFKSFKSSLLGDVDYVTVLKVIIKFSEILAVAEFNQPLMVNALQHRYLSFGISIMASGLLLHPQMPLSSSIPNNEIISRWVHMSKKIKEVYKKTDSLFDIMYLMVWYFLIDNYYYQENMLVENHFEYNSLLSNLLFNKDLMEYPLNRDLDHSKLKGDRLTEFKLLSRFWMKIRMIEADGLYFQYKSSLLRSNHILKNSVIPNTQMLNLVYNGGLKGVSDDVLRLMYEVAKEYFNLFSSVDEGRSNLRTIIQSYMSVYHHFHRLVGTDVFRYQNEVMAGKVPEINYNMMLFFIRNQYTNLVSIKWMTIIRVEKGYFPSLRYTSYMTYILANLNHYLFLDNLITTTSHGRDSLLSVFENSFSLYPMIFVTHSAILVQTFLICLKGYVTMGTYGNCDRIVNLERFYSVLNTKFQGFFAKFRSDFNKSQIRLIPTYRNTMGILEDMNAIQNELPLNSHPKVDRIHTLMNTNLRNYDLYVDHFFGCKSTLMTYLGTLFTLFDFIIETPNTAIVPITPTLNFNDDLVFKYQESFAGFGIEKSTLDEYLEFVVDPVIGK